MSSKAFKLKQDNNDKDKKTSSINSSLKDRKERELASLIAFVLFFGGIIVGLGFYSVNHYNEYLEEQMLANVEDGYYYLPGHQFLTEDLLETYLNTLIYGNSEPLEFKLEVMEYLHKQDYDRVDEYMKIINELYDKQFVIDDKSDNILNMTNTTLGTINGNLATTQQIVDTVEFLKSEGLLDEDFELNGSTNTDGGMTGINTKSAKSYKSLADAEKAYGSKLGIYVYIDALKNYEMVNAYTIEDEFMQCVYAINIDGTPVTEDSFKDDSEGIRTITVKYSNTVKSDELKKVYKEYKEIATETSGYGKIYYCGSSVSTINLIYVDRSDGRSYTLHSADGIKIAEAKGVMGELFGNLELIKKAGE